MFIPILRAVVGRRAKEQEEGANGYNEELCVIINPHRYTVCEEDTMEIEEEEVSWE